MRKAETTNLATNVKRGVALLDQLDPKWSTKVSTASLDMISPDHCVLGQIHKNYSDGLEHVAMIAIEKALKGTGLDKVATYDGSLIEAVSERGYAIDGYYYGFIVKVHEDGKDNERWEQLGQLWTAAIIQRKKRRTDERLHFPAKKPARAVVAKKATRRRA